MDLARRRPAHRREPLVHHLAAQRPAHRPRSRRGGPAALTRDQGPRRPRTAPARAAVAGLLGGAVLQLLHGVLPTGWATLASTSALWGWGAALAAALDPRGDPRPDLLRRGAAAGALALLGAVTGYAVLDAATGAPAPPAATALRCAAALVAGALAGTAGAAARRGGDRARPAALAALGALVAGEGAYGLLLVDVRGAHWWTELVLGLALPALAGAPRRPQALLLTLVGVLVVVAGCLGYDAVMAALA